MTQYARPDATLDDDTESTGVGWTNEAGNANLHLSIDDTSADDGTTYITTTDSSGDEGCLIRLSDVSAPGTSGTYIKYKALTQDESYSGSPSLKLELLQGTSVKATTTNSSVNTSSYTAYSYTISDVSGISDWNDLRLRITMVGNAAMGDYMRVTQVYLETQAAAVETNNSQSFSLVADGAMGTSFSLVGDDESPANVRI